MAVPPGCATLGYPLQPRWGIEGMRSLFQKESRHVPLLCLQPAFRITKTGLVSASNRDPSGTLPLRWLYHLESLELRSVPRVDYGDSHRTE